MSGETWDIVRHGEVVGVDEAACRVMVSFEELEITSDWLPVLQRVAGGVADYWLPAQGDLVVCIFYSDATEEGCVVGSYYPTGSPPPESGSGIYYTRFPDGSLIKWDNGELSIVATGGVSITGDTAITGDLDVTGDLSVTGTIDSGPINSGPIVSTGTVTATAFITA